MTWTPEETALVKRTLIGSWPGTITTWGADAIDAYLYVLQARGLTAEQTLTAIGTWPAGSDFPPSAPNLAAKALEDPSRPTFAEMLWLVQRALKAWNQPRTGSFDNEAAMLKVSERAVLDRAATMHPLVASFVDRTGVERLQREVGELADEQYGSVRRRDLERAWAEHCDTQDRRERFALAAGRSGRGQLGRFDPLASIVEGGRREIASHNEGSST